jgi:hypothetical protein
MAHRWSEIKVRVPALLRRRGRFFWGASSISAALVLFGAGCRQTPPQAGAPETPPPARETAPSQESDVARPPIEDVIALHTNHLLGIQGVVVVFAGENTAREPVITVGVAEKTPEVVRAIPQTLEGYPVVIQETGPVAPR